MSEQRHIAVPSQIVSIAQQGNATAYGLTDGSVMKLVFQHVTLLDTAVQLLQWARSKQIHPTWDLEIQGLESGEKVHRLTLEFPASDFNRALTL